MPESLLSSVELQPSAPSHIVLRDLRRKRIKLSLEDLLDWSSLETVLPDHNNADEDVLLQPRYDLEVDPAKSPLSTRVELPWGIELTPSRSQRGEGVAWRHAIKPKAAGSWTPMWTTALVGAGSKLPQMEVLSVRGFERGQTTGSEGAGNLVVRYRDKPGTQSPTQAPLSNYDRLTIATSLSGRFPYTGRVGPPPLQTALVQYANTCASACYVDGRAIPVEQFRLGALGGWLKFDAHWVPAPSCAQAGWVQRTSLGRDEHVEVLDAGFLYPFGTPCQLLVQSERVFVLDVAGHYVAPVIKQVFLQIAESNLVPIAHAETPFVSVAIKTAQTPPLDLPPGGNASKYREYDFFVPTVNGAPFAFDHEGTDWGGDKHRSAMPLIYISNKATMANGLIWESGYPYQHSQRDAMCGMDGSGDPDATHTIPKSGDGLKVVDKIWHGADWRFAKYRASLAALAKPISKGDTSQRVDWVEWVRAGIPDMSPTVAVARPFGARSRTLRLRLEGIGQMSGQDSSVIATYRDVRSVSCTLLDPDPTAPPDLYKLNVQPGESMSADPYLYLLETRALIGETQTPLSLTDTQRALQIRENYFNATSGTIPDALFFGITNEIKFGESANSESVGGLSVPDTHASILTRNCGAVGDATFNERRWRGYAAKKAFLESIGRVDFAAFRRERRKHLDVQPFDPVRVASDLAALEREARTVMGFATAPAPHIAAAGTRAAGLPSPNLNFGDLFGLDAQILPGLTFADVFRNVLFGGSPPGQMRVASDGDSRSAPPLVWDVRLIGLEPILEMVGEGAGQQSLPQVLAAMMAEAKTTPDAEPYSIGMEASLQWTNDVFKPETIGPLKFEPFRGETRMLIDARSRVDLGSVRVSQDLRKLEFSPGMAVVAASARLERFSITLFDAIKVTFRQVAFVMRPDGGKDFQTEIETVDLVGPLAFISQLSDVLGGIGGDQGIKLDLSPQRVRVSQTLRFPATEGQPLFIGPAQVINLALGWFVMVPLQGRDVLSVGFSVCSREKPLTIYVPPFYGGKAHVLLELTTKGCRLIEVSMEYGALVPVTWTLASGIASLTAGIFYMCEKVVDKAGDLVSGKVVLRAFVKAAADLKVAGFIDFCGLVFIALESNEGAGGKSVKGESTISVSIKIGFVRVSYSFTATREEKQSGGQRLNGRRVALASGAGPTYTDDKGEILYGAMDEARTAAFRRILGGYAAAEGR
ncbi:hypothetical protein ACSFA2_17515 [Variovorax sp. LT2P21]|uniref:hypothetical protein n=1 Tax=Variovorax sp. LT2P21 TaxID=3443731 RepID=UPI003F487E58